MLELYARAGHSAKEILAAVRRSVSGALQQPMDESGQSVEHYNSQWTNQVSQWSITTANGRISGSAPCILDVIKLRLRCPTLRLDMFSHRYFLFKIIIQLCTQYDS